MLDNELLAAIKSGMKGEMDSVTIYEEAAEAAPAGRVRDFFLDRAATEKRHFNYLLEYYRGQTINLNFERDARAELGTDWRTAITSGEFVQQIASSRHLTAAVAASLRMEAEAMRHYRDWAHRTENPELEKVLETLADWERQHYHELLAIQEDLERHHFDVNNFQPF